MISCDRADLRPLPTGVMIYENGFARLDPLPAPAVPRAEVITELYAAVVAGRPPLHDGAWATATLEVCTEGHAALSTRGPRSDAAASGGPAMTKSRQSETESILQHWREAVPNDRLAHLVRDAARALGRSLSIYWPSIMFHSGTGRFCACCGLKTVSPSAN